MVEVAKTAAESLKRDGISVEVVNARFLKPLDENMLTELAHRRNKLIVLEEASQAGSLGSAVLEFYAAAGITGVDVSLMGIPDVFIEHGSIKEQREEVGLTVESVIELIKSARVGDRKYVKQVKPS
jgi:1-deoxy-D-xylulose-5-phosphate synthase